MAAWPTAAAAAFPHTIRWTASPAKSPTGQPLPPAVLYEVWLLVDANPESLVATVADTFWTLQVQPGSVYAARVRGISAQGQKSPFSPWSDAWRAAVAPVVETVAAADLKPAHPNPFNGRTTLTYVVPPDLPPGSTLALAVYDLRGHRVRRLEVERGPGAHEAAWDGADAQGRPSAAGIYLARYVCGSHQATTRLTRVP